MNYKEILEKVGVLNAKFVVVENGSHALRGFLTTEAESSTSVVIYKACFYVKDENFPLNEKTLKAIKYLQEQENKKYE
jgi:hypothetical protein|tara:strand:+ start:153 stop:386 length:234 start_codon:yes stop_codon:yes gene_type:complete